MSVALAHDYLTQRGGAERVVLSLLKAFPEAPIYTSLYDPEGTYPEFRGADVRTSPLDRLPFLRRDHRLALPLLARTFSKTKVEDDVVLCSSSGWAHGTQVCGTKIVYCHSPARWLYATDEYLGGRRRAARVALAGLRRHLERWDRTAAASADRYLTNSTAVKRRIEQEYGIEAEVVPPPPVVDPTGPRHPVDGIEPGFLLCVSRLQPYKNVGALVEAFGELPSERLVVVGAGPDEARLRAAAPPNVRFLGSVSDEELRWVYVSCAGLLAASYEDYGLTPLEAASFGKPSAVLRAGGFLDTVVDGSSGIFFDRPDPSSIKGAVRALARGSWRQEDLCAHAERFSEERFIARIRSVVVDEELADVA
jgi:glycosyltransferase involved in cell wall biosynthesis